MAESYASRFPKSNRAGHGRKWQYIGENKVPKYAYSPWTAKLTGVRYTFYADVILVHFVKYADPKHPETKEITVGVTVGTLQQFRMECITGVVYDRIQEVAKAYGSEVEYVDGFWRNRGEDIEGDEP